MIAHLRHYGLGLLFSIISEGNTWGMFVTSHVIDLYAAQHSGGSAKALSADPLAARNARVAARDFDELPELRELRSSTQSRSHNPPLHCRLLFAASFTFLPATPSSYS